MQYPFSIYFLDFFVQKVRNRTLNCFLFVKKTTFRNSGMRCAGVNFMRKQKKRLTNYSNEYKLKAKVIRMHNIFANRRRDADAAM